MFLFFFSFESQGKAISQQSQFFVWQFSVGADTMSLQILLTAQSTFFLPLFILRKRISYGGLSSAQDPTFFLKQEYLQEDSLVVGLTLVSYTDQIEEDMLCEY